MATLPPILVELKANSSELKAKLGEIQGEFKKTASEGQSMGQKLKEHFGTVSLAVGGALAGAGAALSALGSKDQAAQQQLRQSIENTGKSYDDYKERVEKTIKSQEKFGNDASQTQDAVRILTQATGDASSALDDMQLVSNLAAAKHESLTEAATQVAKAHGGAAKIFKEFGITVGTNITGAKDYDQALAVLSNKLSGQAAAASDTFTGKITAMKTHVEDMAASFGTKFGPALQIGGGALAGLGTIANGVSGIIGKFQTASEAATVATEGLTVAEDAEAVSSGLALGPILLIVGAVAAVGVAIFELWTHWSTVWGWIKNAASDAWDWIHKHIVLILTVALGPLGLAIGELGTHWSQIWDGIKGAVSSVWDFISGIFDKIKGGVKDVGNAIKDVPGAIVNSIPGAGLVKGLLGHLATGGTAYGNQPYIVGENGPELFVPGASGAVVPNHALGGGGTSIGSMVFNINGAQDPAAVRAEILRIMRSNVNGGLS